MGSFGRKTVRKTAYGVAVCYGARVLFDVFNERKMLQEYRETGEIPKKKSMVIALLLGLLFGSPILLLYTPRTAIPLIICEIVMIPFLFLNFILRPVVMFIAFVGVLSHNRMVIRLFGRYGGEQRK